MRGFAQSIVRTDRTRSDEVLRHSEERYRSLVDATAAIVWDSPASGSFDSEQPGWTKFTGQTVEQHRGWGWLDAVHPGDREKSARAWDAAVATQTVYIVEHRLRKADGEYRHMAVRAIPILDGSGAIREWVGVHTDVTERMRAEQGLAERARLASLVGDVGLALASGGALREVLGRCAEAVVRRLDAAFARIWTLNESERELELQASEGMYTHLDGLHGRVPVGKFKIGLIAQERRPHLTNAVVGDPRVGEQEWAKREGMVAFAGYPLLAGPRVVGVIALFARQPLSDTALQSLAAIADQIALGIDRRRAEESLRAAERRLHHVVASSPVVLFTLALAADRIRGIDWIGDNLWDVLGHRPGAALSPDWWPANIHPDDRERVIARTDAELFGRGRATHEYRFRHGDGGYRWTRGELRLIRDAAGRPAEVVGSWSDITELKSLEEQFRQAQKMEAVGQLAGGVAHDFNNLLTVINGYGELVHAALPPDHPSRELVAEIQKAGDRAAGLTRQLLAFSRKSVLETQVLDLNALVRNLEGMLRRLIGEDVDLATRPAGALGRIKADPGQLEQALVNLCVNARDAMPRGGQITIETHDVELDETYAGAHPDVRPGPYVLIAVTDTGAGMTPEVQARIFEPFYTTKGAGKGTGLGLAMVFGFAKQSGGHVAVYSEPGRGATFKLYLPRVAETPSGRPSVSPTVMPKGTETVLLVEDEDAVRALARHVLRLCGYVVLEGRHGREAVGVAAAHAGPIHLLVTDVVMPGGMGGREVAEAVVALHPEARVLYTSGYTDDAVVRHGVLEAGMPFLQKPFAPAALAGKVRRILDATAVAT